ncbi:hypothetical protein KUV62_21035 [Salipiger bermudensis]|uniref:DUF6525 family protein n=1 Tax=Salipiger bermudensis TaxID=344736 RepID=UPI001C992250|nr:DUF6525 family protein [Salipiger bermudensis]MBY6006422.1 hypothetical protein [Salipiger bermudensis]
MAARISNLRSSLKRRSRQGDAMARFDRLPPDLRRWLAQAALPWSPRSALRLWQRALARHGGDTDAALAHLGEVERATLRRDTAYRPASGARTV